MNAAAPRLSHRLHSLRIQLVVWLLLPLLILLGFDAWLTYNRALGAANAAFDRMLLTSARAIGEGVSSHNGQIEVDLPYFALQMFEVNSEGRVFYRVSEESGRQLTGYEDLPLPPPAHRNEDNYQPRYYDAVYHGEKLRVIALRQQVRDLYTMRTYTVWVQVAETPESRQELAQGILFGAIGQEAILVLLVLVIVLVAVGRGLRPLHRLSAEMAERDEADLTPLKTDELQSELKPLGTALNQYITRIQRMLAARRRFFADAAHQLKTPLAVGRAQAELALRETDLTNSHAQVDKVLGTLRQASHGVQQLLSLSRLEPDSGHSITLETLDLTALARSTALEWAPVARRQGIDLGLEPIGPATVSGQANLLQEMIGNLIDNAIRYSHRDNKSAPNQVTVAVGCDDAPFIQVVDHGPGIPQAEREKVFLRFYRMDGTKADGTGLGLPIVREIARLHDASVELGDTVGGGLTVTVRFPAPQEDPPAEPAEVGLASPT